MTRHPSAARDQAAYDELQCYTLSRGDAEFVHQHVVDAWTAQHADAATKPIGLAFALIGLCLCVEWGVAGRTVQRVHMALARPGREWPRFPLPLDRGTIRATHVLEAPPGAARNEAIHRWCASVWSAYSESHDAVAGLLVRHEAEMGRLLREAT